MLVLLYANWFVNNIHVLVGMFCLAVLSNFSLDDPFERKDVAWAFPKKVQQMISQIEQLELSAFNPHRGSTDARACESALARGNFWGPWLE